MKRRVTREDIIRTTRDLIIRDGIRAVRVDEIAQKLEISKRTLYELFSDKDTLVEQCWDKIREEQEKKIAGYLFYQPGSALEQAQNLIREYIDALYLISYFLYCYCFHDYFLYRLNIRCCFLYCCMNSCHYHCNYFLYQNQSLHCFLPVQKMMA